MRTCTFELQTHEAVGISRKELPTTVIPLSTLAPLRSLFQTTMYGLAMADAPNAFTGRPNGYDDDESEFTLTSNKTRSLNEPNNAVRNDNLSGQLEALYIMQQYLQPSSSSSGFRNGSLSKSFQHPSVKMAVARAPEWPLSPHATDHTIFATSEVIKQKILSEKEDDDDRLLNQILFASDDQKISSQVVACKMKGNTNSYFADGKEITAYTNRPNPDHMHHHDDISSVGNASSHPEVVDNTVFNSSVWHPTYQPHHQEVKYTESIFETDTATVGVHPLEVHDPLHASTDRGHLAFQPSTYGTDALLYAAKLAVATQPQKVPATVDPSRAASKEKPKRKKEARCSNERDDKVVNVAATNSVSCEHDSISAVNIRLIPHYEITENDVLLGRGGRTNHHVGNKYYLECKAQLQEQYLHADKDEKTILSQQLVQMIHDRNGRFLKLADPELLERVHRDVTRYGDSNLWYEVSLAVARRKASQTLRELNTPELRAAKRAKYAK
jgi:hypothetical protein